MVLKLASLFQDHAVLQRGKPLTIWGWAEPRTEVKITLDSVCAYGLVNERGRFSTVLPAIEYGEGLSLEVVNVATQETVLVRDLSMGEVWLCAGQSNMEWPMKNSLPLVEEDIATAKLSSIRYFTVTKVANLGRQETVGGQWKLMSPESAPDCSAVAFSFARKVQHELSVPVGIIISAWGGTFIESWMSEAAHRHVQPPIEHLDTYAVVAHSPERRGKGLKEQTPTFHPTFPEDDGNQGWEKGWHQPLFDDRDWSTMELPSTWQNQGLAHSGVLWFRKMVDLPAAWRGRKLILNTGALDKTDISYVNGEEVGRTGTGHEMRFWSIPRSYPFDLEAEGPVYIAIRVNSFVYDGGMIGPVDAMSLHPEGEPENAIRLAGQWRYQVEQDYGVVEVNTIRGHLEPNSPYILFDNMIAPLAPYALKGFLWYQGESNTARADHYQALLEALFDDWRYHWAEKDIPALIVQLPDYMAESNFDLTSNWAALREGQRNACSDSRNHLAVALGFGEAEDIHPRDKLPIGENLAQLALAHTYAIDIVPSGPMPVTLAEHKEGLACTFFNTGEGLRTSDGLPAQPVFIAGHDGKFAAAKVRLEKEHLIASHPEVTHPVRMAYAYANNPTGQNLINSEGLAASPFLLDLATE